MFADHNYPLACVNGLYVAKWIYLFIKENGLDPSRIHIIGMGLGAHIAGFVGKSVQENMNKDVDKITGIV